MDFQLTNNNSLFNQLPLELSVQILSQLDSKDLSNLCLTCQKWYETVHSLPESLKHITKSLMNLRMTSDGLLGTKDELLFTPLSRLLWFKKLKVQQFCLTIDITRSGEFAYKDFLEFMYRNRSKLEIEWFYVRMVFDEDDFPTVYGILDLAKILAKYVEVDYPLLSPIYNRTSFLTEIRFFHSLDCKDHIELDTINQILKQWVRGEREKLMLMEINFNGQKEMGLNANVPKMFESLTNGIEENVEKHGDFSVRRRVAQRYACDFDLFSSIRKRANIKFDGFVFRFLRIRY